MDHERSRRALELFESVRDLAQDERARRINDECAGDAALREEVESLLAHDRDPHVVLRGENAVGAGAGILVSEMARERGHEAGPLPERIGRYRPIRAIGEGGMGTVYEAEQEHPRRVVALKLLRSALASRELRRRFEYEAQILGRLQHPAIAQVIEAGMADLAGVEQPYIVMELIRGQRLDEHVRSHDLSLRECLLLFLRICDGVQHAHQKGIIHRDLKPGNILVASIDGSDPATDETRIRGSASAPGTTSSKSAAGRIGQPKVLDFGLAKLTEADITLASLATEHGRIQGTLAYMSPEQARGATDEIDVRSDVYALGVILYQLISGEMPYDVSRLSFSEAVRVVCESPPKRLTVTGRGLRGDLETIVAKVLEKDPARRYSSVAALSEDVARFLSDQPILARPASAAYQLRKLVARHKLPFAFAAILFLLVTSFAVWMSFLYARADSNLQRARAAERAAAAEAETAKRTTTFLTDLFKVSDPSEARGTTVTAQEILERGADRVQRELADQPRVQASLMHTIGLVYNNLGLYKAAGPFLEGALAIRKKEFGFDSLEYAESAAAMALWYDDTGETVTSEALLREALDIRRKKLGERNLVVAETMNALGGVLIHKGDASAAEPLLQAGLAIRAELLPGGGLDTHEGAQAQHNLGVALMGLDKDAEAERHLRAALATLQRLFPDGHPDIGSTSMMIGFVLEERHNFNEAGKYYRDALAMSRRMHKTPHPNVANALDGLGKVHLGRGEYDLAEPYLREAIGLYKEMLGEDNPKYAWAITNLGVLYFRRGDYSAAEPLYRKSIELERKQAGGDDADVASALNNLGALLWEKGELDEAERVLQQALALKAQLPGVAKTDVARTMDNLSGVYLCRGSLDEAERLSREALAIRQQHLGRHPDVGQSLNNLADILQEKGNLDEALGLYPQAKEILIATLGAGHPHTTYPISGMGQVLLKKKSYGEAEVALREALAICEKTMPPSHPDAAVDRAALAFCIAVQGNLSEAESHIQTALAVVREKLPPEERRRRRVVAYAVQLYEASGKLELANQLRSADATKDPGGS